MAHKSFEERFRFVGVIKHENTIYQISEVKGIFLEHARAYNTTMPNRIDGKDLSCQNKFTRHQNTHKNNKNSYPLMSLVFPILEKLAHGL